MSVRKASSFKSTGGFVPRAFLKSRMLSNATCILSLQNRIPLFKFSGSSNPYAGLSIHLPPSPASFNFFSVPFASWSLRQCVSWRWIRQDSVFVATLKSNCLPFIHVIALCSHILNSFMLHLMVADQRFVFLETFSSSFGMLVLAVTCCWCARVLLLPSCLYY